MNIFHRTVLFSACALALGGCVKRVPAPKLPEHRALKLLSAVPEKETAEFKEQRSDLEVDTRDMDRTPHVVATGESELIQLGGARAHLSGDEQGTQPWSVDNFLLVDVLDKGGKRLGSFVVGYAEGVLRGNERLDNVGPMAFHFGPREIDVTSHLPDNQPFRLQVTALDYGGVGHVSDVYLVLDRGAGTSGGDDLRGQ